MELLAQIAHANGGLVTRRQAVAAGIPSRQLERLARSGVIARVRRGIYAVATIADLPQPWVVTRGLYAVLSYMSAAAWWGVDLPRAADRVHVTVPRHRRRHPHEVPGVRIHRAHLRGSEMVSWRGVAVTSPLRTCLDIARHASLEDAVVVLDGFLRRRLLTCDELVAALQGSRGPGAVRMRLVAVLVDPQSGSVLESLARVLLWRHGLRPSASQFGFTHGGTGWRGYLDFAWPELKVALECDGYEFHADPDTFRRDRRRWSTLSRSGWRCGVVTWFDVTGDPDYVVDLVTDLLGVRSPRRLRHTTGAGVTAEAV